MNRPTVAQAEAWNPDALRRTADDWDAAAADLQSRDAAVGHTSVGSPDFWSGSAAQAARGHGAGRRRWQLIEWRCGPMQPGDRVGGVGDVVGDCTQSVQIDYGVSPHASCWQITALWR